MDPSSQFIVPTIIDVPELIVTNDDLDYDMDSTHGFTGGGGGLGGAGSSAFWTGKLQFISSSLCYTIGLGNLWRFPYLCYKHAGGAYLIAYTLVIITIGLPLMLMELAFGQYANEGPITIWRISPAFEGIGYSMCLISTLIAIYYNLINTWLMQYLFATLTFGPLPWTNCDNHWNSGHCFYKPEENFDVVGPSQIANCSTNRNITTSATTNSSSILLSPDFDNNISNCNNSSSSANATNAANSFDKILNTTNEVNLPSNEYFHEHVLGLTNKTELLADGIILGSWQWHLIFNLILAWLLVFIVLLKNIRPSWSSLSLSMLTTSTSSNNSSNPHHHHHYHQSITNRLALMSLIMPHLALFALLVRSLTLPGSQVGVLYYITPQWERLQNIDIWTDAITQIFFSLSPCWGGIITLANMNKFHNNFHSNTCYIVLVNYFTSISAGLMAFGVLGYMSTYSGISLDQVVDSGIGFVFQVYPEALSQMPLTQVNSFVFFGILLLLGLTSQLTVIETVITTIVDTWPHKLRYRRPLVLMLLCASMFLLSLPLCFGNGFYLAQMLDSYAGTMTGMLIGILELIAIAWVYGMENFMQDIDDMISVHRNLFPSRSYWYFMWRYLTPSTLFAILLFTITDFPQIGYRDLESLPSWMLKLGWILSVMCASVIPLIALIRLALSPGGSWADKISYLCRPSEDWAPSSYISGPKLLNRHQMFDDRDLQSSRGSYSECATGAGGQESRSESALGCDGIKMSPGSSDHHAQPATTSARNDYKDLVSDDDDDDNLEHDNSNGTMHHFRRSNNRRNNHNDDDEDDDDEEDLKLVDGKASYIIPEEEDEEEEDTDTGLITSNV